MWCPKCQQEVPAMTSNVGAALACLRCQHSLPAPSSGKAMSQGLDHLLDPQVDRRLREIGRSLRTPLAVSSATSPSGSHHWVDSPHRALPIVDVPQIEPAPHHTEGPSAARASLRSRQSDRRTQWMAWLTTSIGLGLVLAGVGLIAFSLIEAQVEFWPWGVGITLAGQAVLIAGLIRVLTSLWSSSRSSTQRILAVQQELNRLQQTADTLLGQRASSSAHFYGELARSASPSLLLANLKGQLDHLATKLNDL